MIFIRFSVQIILFIIIFFMLELKLQFLAIILGLIFLVILLGLMVLVVIFIHLSFIIQIFILFIQVSSCPSFYLIQLFLFLISFDIIIRIILCREGNQIQLLLEEQQELSLLFKFDNFLRCNIMFFELHIKFH